MEPNSDSAARNGDVQVAGLRERAHQTLVDGDASGDDERLKLLESLLDALEQELERDVGEAATPRR